MMHYFSIKLEETNDEGITNGITMETNIAVSKEELFNNDTLLNAHFVPALIYMSNFIREKYKS